MLGDLQSVADISVRVDQAFGLSLSICAECEGGVTECPRTVQFVDSQSHPKLVSELTLVSVCRTERGQCTCLSTFS